jgi:protein-S-isoprenylcysteine O-methyltransferase Ste14
MKGTDNPGVFVPPPLLFLVALGAGILVDGNVLDWRHVTHPAQLSGVAVGAAGFVLILVSLGLFRRFKTRPEPWEASTTLIRSGIYRFSRNPMYLGMALFSAGIAIFFESIAAVGLLVLVVIAIDRLVIAREERYLSRRFGPEYETYRAEVRRWL